MRLILARHGQSMANVDPAYAGKDSPLTELGERQADLLGQWLKKHQPEIDHIVCSPLRRAQQTAQIANQHLGLPIEVCADLMEITRHELISMPRRRSPFDVESTYHDPASDGYYEDYREQVQRALDLICKDLSKQKPTLVVSHGGTGGTLLRLIFERHDMRFLTYNTAMHFIAWESGHWHIDALNAVPHLTDGLIS